MPRSSRLTSKGREALRGGKRKSSGGTGPRNLFSRGKEDAQPGEYVNGIFINGEEARVWHVLISTGPGWEAQATFGPRGKLGSRKPDFLHRQKRLVIEHQTAFHRSDVAIAKDALKKAQYERLGYRVAYTDTRDLPRIRQKVLEILGGAY